MSEPAPQSEQRSSTTHDFWVGPTIGDGAFGQVVYAKHKTTQREVAIKVIDKITVKKFPFILPGLYQERKMILDVLRGGRPIVEEHNCVGLVGDERSRKVEEGECGEEVIEHEPGSKTTTTKERCNDKDDSHSSSSAGADDTTVPVPVIQIWASFHDSQCLYVVMELATGGNLQSLIEHIFLPNDTNMDAHADGEADEDDEDENLKQHHQHQRWIDNSIPFYVRQLIDAVNFIHSRGVVHCDLKPANVLLKTNGRVCLADFASAVEIRRSVKASETESVPIHQALLDLPRGTAEYSCPELLKNSQREGTHSISNAADYWSVGCILHTMMFGLSPFHRETEALTLDAVMAYAKAQDGRRRSGQPDDGSSEAANAATDHTIESKYFSKQSAIMLELYNDAYRPNSANASGRKQIVRDRNGLLEVDPSTRTSYWSSSIVPLKSHFNIDTASVPTPGVFLPMPPWKHELEDCELKDGNGGWAVFQL